MRLPYIFIDRNFLAEAELAVGYTAMGGLSGGQVIGVVMIHELLHAAGRIPHDGGGSPSANAQSRLNNLLVKLFCITIPNQLLSTPIELQNSPILRGLPHGGGVVGGGGSPRLVLAPGVLELGKL